MALSGAAPGAADQRPPRSRNARGDGEKLREQLIEATVALLDAEGDASRVSVRGIARAAGVSPTALYLHFPDRDALVAAAVDRGFAAFNDALTAAAIPHEEPRSRIRAMGRAYLEFAERQPALYAVIFSARRPAHRPATVPDDLGQVRRDEALDGLVATVTAAAPDADAIEVRDIALALWAGLHGYATLHARQPVKAWPDAGAYADRLLEAHLGG